MTLKLALADPEDLDNLTEISCEADFLAATARLSGSAVLCQTEPSDEAPAGRDADPLGRVTAATEWSEALEMLRRGNQTTYLQGDCWHLALAFNRLYGLPVVAVVNHRDAGESGHPHPDERKDTVGHVAVSLPDGRFLDIRGVLDGEESLCEGTASTPLHSVRPSSPDEIVSILDDYERVFEELGGPAYRPDWNDPSAYPFAARTEALARLVFGDAVERLLGANPSP